MELPAIYELIHQELDEVEAGLLALAGHDLSPQLRHTLNYKGKRTRPALTLLAGKLFHPTPQLKDMAMAVELFHTATLVHDDIVDRSPLRRGKPTPHHLWGEGIALLLGDYLFSKAAELVAATRNIQVINLFAQTLTTVSSGELRQGLSPAEAKGRQEHYLEWIGAKTASVFSLATQSGAILSQAGPTEIEALGEYGFHLGLAFQIVDDILDFIGEEKETGKPVGSDLLQGTPTLPLILFREQHHRETPSPPEERERVVQLITQSPAIEECYGIAREFSLRAQEALRSLPSSPALTALSQLVEYNLQRRS